MRVLKMPVMKKLIELPEGRRLWVRQASGMEKLKIEAAAAKAFRKVRHYGNNPTEWTEEQQEHFQDLIDELGGGLEEQIRTLIPKCVLKWDDNSKCDPDTLLSEEILAILPYIKGEDSEGSLPLDN